jgi:hypothetical protein
MFLLIPELWGEAGISVLQSEVWQRDSDVEGTKSGLWLLSWRRWLRGLGAGGEDVDFGTGGGRRVGALGGGDVCRCLLL